MNKRYRNQQPSENNDAERQKNKREPKCSPTDMEKERKGGEG